MKGGRISRKMERWDNSANCEEEGAKRVEEQLGVTLMPSIYKIYTMCIDISGEIGERDNGKEDDRVADGV